MNKKNIYKLDQNKLKEAISELGQKPFRAKQLWGWLYDKGVSSFQEMTNLPASLLEALNKEFSLGSLEIETEQVSTDGTIKRLYKLPDGQLIESVLMQYEDGRRTACISSQAGCALGCVFCATGQMGFARHLTSDEIFEQALLYSNLLKQKGERLSNIVYMGMGEPFHNFDPVMESVNSLRDLLGIGSRHITISTAGMVPQIRKFANLNSQVNLAISLHEINDSTRSELMPINKTHSLTDLLDACHYYVKTTNRRISFEWALIKGKNDSSEQARDLATFLKGLHCHVNLIPLNETTGYNENSAQSDNCERFAGVLNKRGIPATLRRKRGIDISAGCGQLKSEIRNKIKKTSQKENTPS